MEEYKVGDTVKILIGHIALCSETEYKSLGLDKPILGLKTYDPPSKRRIYIIDLAPELVGKIGTITEIEDNNVMLKDVPSKVGWYPFNTIKKYERN
jgi:hypothetical protein